MFYPTMREVIIASVFFLLGAVAQFTFVHYILPRMHKLYVWFYSLRKHHKYGEPCKTDLLLKRKGYSLGYSLDRRCALWVSYIITKGSVGVDLNRTESFYPDVDIIPERFRVKPEDFTNTGYDKGHLAPSAAIDYSISSNRETFAMSNVALQDPKLNRQAWSALENTVRTWTYTKGKLCVTTGPIYGKRSKRIKEIPVPKEFYKVIYSFKHHKWIGFLLPNKPVGARDLWNYAMSVRDLEKETGLKFMMKLPKQYLNKKKELDIDWWKAI